MKTAAVRGLDISLVIKARPERILKAFFDPDALAAWWQAAHSVTTPRVLGPYALEWRPTDYTDDLLGRLGGVFRGTVMQYEPSRGFFVADSFWLPPDGEPIGPMALEVVLTPVESPDDPGVMATDAHVMQTGFEESLRWRRYYEVAGVGWERALKALKTLLEK